MVVRHASPETASAVLSLRVPIESLDPDPKNYNEHPEEQVTDLVASLKTYKQIRPIVVRARPHNRYLIVAGHGLILAASHLIAREPIRYAHLSFIDVVVAPDEWDDTKARGYMMADNETGRKAEVDQDKLLTLLKEQERAGSDLRAFGTDQEGLRQMLEAAEQRASEGVEVDAHHRSTELDAPSGGEVEPVYNLLIECKSEDEQRRAYDLVSEEGFSCRVLTL